MDKLTLSHLDINSVTKELRKDSLSIKNRLQSIIYDALFVESTKDKVGLPLVPNERCGLWYVPPNKQKDTSYFKSTDGHTGEWSFSLRRLNFHLLPKISAYGGIAIIDSTRKGKLMPDALLKTIPIWCAVLNTILYEGDSDKDILDELRLEENYSDAKFILSLKNEHNWVSTPKFMVFASERNEISKLISSFANEVKKLNLVTKEKLIQHLDGKKRPLIPQWHYPGCKNNNDDLSTNDPFFFDHEQDSNAERAYFLIQCITASKKTNEYGGSVLTVRNNLTNGEIKLTSWYYIQGSADDHELWATKEICDGNLDSRFFWDNVVSNNGKQNEDVIDKDTGYIYDWISENELILKINRIYEKYVKDRTLLSDEEIDLDVSYVKNDINDTGLVFGIIDRKLNYNSFISKYQNVTQLVIFSEYFGISNIPDNPKITILQFKVESSKKGSKKLREVFPKIIPQLDIQHASKNDNIMILCETGKDISTGLVLVLLCKYFNLDWAPLQSVPKISKDMVKQQLCLLLNVRKVNPSRNTLQSVNTYIM
ncbi:uncharacterized protein AC631_03729 [Debaryomyces fabryi]|uniref:tRNA A64-2'-O-ribosylphosphate transferase n=1 Tax=Debaryomyces fabryi TaxID=58627 RepID=A0A0V1PWF6_9ASCO|nr:uncharacterized protein AC631_03729 [Debaryomyces fabryi]KSA00498.1 hypothetical protein AC631_03729 [Debaryomyces fabryi]CUM45571.1 unnamed protein product [Debaryomyces fabryi]